MSVAALGLLGGAGQLAGSIYTTNKQMADNEKTRQYNLRLAEKQNEWNLAQWRNENAYNTPSAQKARLEAAGLNADMLYGHGTLQNVAASSPQLTSGSPAAYNDWSSLASGIQSSVDTYLDAQLKQAQINKLNSETEGQDITNDILASDSKFRDAWNQGQLATMYSTIHLQGINAKSTEQLTDQQIKESQSRILQIDANVRQIDASIKSIYNAIRNDNVRLDIDKALSEANIKKAAASANLDYASAKSITSQLEYILRNLQADHELKLQQKINLGREADILLSEGKTAKFEAEVKSMSGYNGDMSVWQNTMMFLNEILSTLGSLIHK